MFFSLAVITLLIHAGRAASDLDPDVEGEDEMAYALVSLSFLSFFKLFSFFFLASSATTTSATS